MYINQIFTPGDVFSCFLKFGILVNNIVQSNVVSVPIEIGPPILHLVNFLSGKRAHLRLTATMGRSVLILLILLILIVVRTERPIVAVNLK